MMKLMTTFGFNTKCAVPKGSLVIWSSEVVHRGGANKSEKDRPVFYFSLLGSTGEKPVGATYSLRPEDRGTERGIRSL